MYLYACLLISNCVYVATNYTAEPRFDILKLWSFTFIKLSRKNSWKELMGTLKPDNGGVHENAAENRFFMLSNFFPIIQSRPDT